MRRLGAVLTRFDGKGGCATSTTSGRRPYKRNSPSRVTLQDVAERAGVSRTTASFVTTGRRDMGISARAEERVNKAARELGYRPSLLARGLRTNLFQTIGLISDVVATEPYAGDLIRGSLSTAIRQQHLMLIAESGGDSKLEEQLIHGMLDRGVDGFVYAALSTRRTVLSRSLHGHPVVLLNCLTAARGIPAVIPDDHGAGRAAAGILLAEGHRDSIYLVGETPAHVVGAAARISGVKAALSEAGVRLAGQLESLWWPEEAYAAVHALLASPARPTALICLNDRVAFGAYQAIGEAGLAIPQDLSVVSFDDSDLASWLRPALTSIAIPHFDMGRRAVELLLDRSGAGEVERMPMPVHHRASVGPPRHPSRSRPRRGVT
jgi:LacI family transcriptional regulator